MEYKDYYQVLGLERSATQEDVKRAYRKLARKYHPDINKEADAEAKFKEVGEAYEVLKDPEKRAAYDQLGSNWQSGQDFRPPPNWDAGFEFSGSGFGAGADYSDFFESLFGHAFGAERARSSRRSYSGRGEDHHAKVLIDLEDSFQGTTRQMTLKVPGLDENGRPQSRLRTLNVKIPKGVKPGQSVRLAGQGAPGAGHCPAGDLYLEVEFRPHRFFRVDGSDIYLDLPVAPWEAALGATVKVPTPEGVVELKVPPGSRSGSKLRLKGRGIPGKPVGDLFATLTVAVPPADSEKAKALYQQMAQEMPFNPRSQLGV